MAEEQFAGKMSALLAAATRELARFLAAALPPLDQSWWDHLVLPNLSYSQRERIGKQADLLQLDLAALLRVLDKNWYVLSSRRNFSQQDHHYAKEMQTIRNRWAHLGATGFDEDDAYRDADTLQRFLVFVGASVSLVDAAKTLKQKLLRKGDEVTPKTETPPPVATPEAQQPRTGIQTGSLVFLASDPSRTGAVLSVEGSTPSSRCMVFMDNRPQPFYLSQLQLVPLEEKPKFIWLNELHALLTALQIRHPSLSTLYSLNAARIDFVPYQFRPALKIIQSDQPRILVADSVGVGKTIEAGLIMRELQARSNVETVLVVCPKPLVAERKWELEMRRFDERFDSLDGNTLRYCIRETDLEEKWPDKYAKCIVPYSLLQDETVLHGKTGRGGKQLGLLQLDPPPKFDLVIVDEAHHVRNSNTLAHQAVRFFCEHAEAVVFLTATPVQLGNNDLFTLLNLLRPDLVIDQETFAHMAEPNPFINQALSAARAGGDGWQHEAREALAKAAATAWGQSILAQDPVFVEVVQALEEPGIDRDGRVALIHRIEGFHSFSRIINRTRRRDIGTFCVRKPETVSVPFTPEQKRLHDSLLEYQASVLAAVHGGTSVNFMMSTIRRQAASCLFGLAPFIEDILQRRLDDLEWLDGDPDGQADADSVVEALKQGAKTVMEQARSLPMEDPKYEALLHILKEKETLPNNKAMVFSSFRHTLRYLERRLRNDGLRVGLVHGGVKDEERLELRFRFERNREEKEALDVLLFSEVGCEGLDYQFCDVMVNYDLPWNPMRIEQRIGRIDRRGQKSEAVAIVNMVVPCTVDADIYERCLMRIGVFEASIGECEEILGGLCEEIQCIAQNLQLTEAERRKKLEQLADNEIGKIQEQRRLEEQEHELFGIRLPSKATECELQEAENYWLSPASIQRMVANYLQQRTGNPDAILGQDTLKTLRLAQEARNRLLEDFQKLGGAQSRLFREWGNYLKGGEPHCQLTFDSATASDHREAQFIMPLHPLVMQSAAILDAPEPVHTAFRIQDDSLPSGRHAFAIYAWEMKGLRPELRLVPICSVPELSERLLAQAEAGIGIEPSEHQVSDENKRALDHLHHARWEAEKARHIEKTIQVARYRIESLDASHRARLSVLQGQLEAATNDKIRKMKQAQLDNANADYDRKRAALEAARTAADIHARPVVFGTLMVEE